jgi:hypothetical protein
MWVLRASGEADSRYKIDEECIVEFYQQGMHALAPKLGAMKANEQVYIACRYGCRKALTSNVFHVQS